MHRDLTFALLLGAMIIMIIASVLPGLNMFKPGFLRSYKLWKVLLFVFFVFMLSILIKGG